MEEYIFPYLKYPRTQFSNVSMTSTYLHHSLRICGGRNANQPLFAYILSRALEMRPAITRLMKLPENLMTHKHVLEKAGTQSIKRTQAGLC